MQDSDILSVYSLPAALAMGLFDEQALLQLRLPMALGGAGMRRAVEHYAGAYLASVMRAAEVDGCDKARLLSVSGRGAGASFPRRRSATCSPPPNSRC
jgi:hypothetical protein